MILERIDVRLAGRFDVPFPKMVKVRQHFDRAKLGNIPEAVISGMDMKLPREGLRGKRIAVTAGSRGIDNLPLITRTVADQLKRRGALPFIVPAMGSHGGATAEGQREVLAGYGITEESMGVPVVSSMEAVRIGETRDGIRVYCDGNAARSDGIVVINRIKPHADFKADYESGLLKMMAIGLGKHTGATILHSHGFESFGDLIPRAARVVIDHAPVLLGLAILENAYDETMKIEVLAPGEMIERERALLREAKKNIATLRLPAIDVLIVEHIGKDISGEGMDPNVTGRPGSGLPGFTAPPIGKIVVLGVTEMSHGNGVGIGMADITTIRCLNRIDFSTVYINAITATILDPAKIPLAMNTDREALVVALKTAAGGNPEGARMVRIRNTREIHEIEISEACLSELAGRKDITVLSDPQPMKFTDEGWLI